jgi:hypothetical protein
LGNAGLAAVEFLQYNGLAAPTVVHSSARIAEAQSTLATGVISSLNARAHALGIQENWACQHAVDFLLTTYRGKV